MWLKSWRTVIPRLAASTPGKKAPTESSSDSVPSSTSVISVAAEIHLVADAMASGDSAVTPFTERS